MKRIMAVMLLLLAAVQCAQAEDTGSFMKVINCEQWVSLREKPDTTSACLVEVPLGAMVENCRTKTKAFTYAEYNGLNGYIMSKYLEEIPMDQALLGDMQVTDRGAWIPMHMLSSAEETVIQWLAPGTRVQMCVDSMDGFAYGLCNGMRGYIRLSDLEISAQEATQ